jgi:AcrR family transcriptional regulator
MNENSLRERKKRELRAHLAEVAFQLFCERGFQEVKVADIAFAANVSEKTVFNYFATKEDLLLFGREQIETLLLQAVQERDPNVPILKVIKMQVVGIVQHFHEMPLDKQQAFNQLIESAPSIQARMNQRTMVYENQLGKIIAEMTNAKSSNPTPYVIASITCSMVKVARGLLGEFNQLRTLEEKVAEIEAVFDQLALGFKNY